jgi:hypothetical protein
MEALIIILVVTVGYLTFHMKKSDSQDEEFDRLKDRLDTALDESPYKLEPIVATKRKTRKRTVKKVVLKKPKVVKKKTVKKKVKTKRKVKK